jgi:hypothetical protein
MVCREITKGVHVRGSRKKDGVEDGGHHWNRK